MIFVEYCWLEVEYDWLNVNFLEERFECDGCWEIKERSGSFSICIVIIVLECVYVILCSIDICVLNGWF